MKKCQPVNHSCGTGCSIPRSCSMTSWWRRTASPMRPRWVTGARCSRLLDDPSQPVDINWWRPGGTAWFTVLHQAAWHGAPTEVAAELIRRGALRSLTDSRGRTAYDIRLDKDSEAPGSKGVVAQQQKTFVLRERYLKPPPSVPHTGTDPCTQPSSHWRHRQPYPWRAVRRSRSTAGVALPARGDPSRGTRATRVVPRARHVRGLRHHAAAGLSRCEELVPGCRRFRPGACHHHRGSDPRR